MRTFAAKRRYRRWTGGGHRVHATMVARGAPLDEVDGTRRRPVKVGGRELACEFLETGDDPDFETLLASRVRAPGNLWVLMDGVAIPQGWR